MPPTISETTKFNDFLPGGIEPLVTAEELAVTFQVSVRTVHNWAHAGTIPVALRVGKVVRFAMSEVVKALRDGSHRLTVEGPQEQQGGDIV